MGESKVSYINGLIFEFRGVKVMVDADLATLYGTETKRLKQQVNRNLDRFPSDFIFKLDANEKAQLIEYHPRFHRLKHSSVNPLAFTEQGVAMLSSVLRTKTAVRMNIEIMRAFARYRAILIENKDLKKEILEMDVKFSKAFNYLVKRLDELSPKVNKRNRIGFKQKGEGKR